MLITRESAATGRVHTMDLPVTPEQLAAWRSGTFIQDAMPQLSPAEREFLISGTTPEEWAELFGAECTVPGCSCTYDHGEGEPEPPADPTGVDCAERYESWTDEDPFHDGDGFGEGRA